MIVDTSAVVAIVKNELESEILANLLVKDGSPRMSAASYVEAGVVVDSDKDPLSSRQLDQILDELKVSIEPVTVEQAIAARQAYRDFGKGSGHPAQLNFGDCFSYALASEAREPLLFTGDDFIHTDIQPAI